MYAQYNVASTNMEFQSKANETITEVKKILNTNNNNI